MYDCIVFIVFYAGGIYALALLLSGDNRDVDMILERCRKLWRAWMELEALDLGRDGLDARRLKTFKSLLIWSHSVLYRELVATLAELNGNSWELCVSTALVVL